MRRFLFTLMTCILLLNGIRAQEKPIYYEKVEGNTFRFYFDKNYYLAEKNCEFKSIERVVKLNTKTQKFDGSFKDFNNNGRLILEGNYNNGVKEGLFKAYHSNGKIKWEATFVNNIITGEVNHYYPNNKPAMNLLYTDSVILINNFWLPEGVQKVINGNGTFAFSIPFEGYNRYGFEFYMAKGKIKDGKQDGKWRISGYNKGEEETLIATESYQNGELILGNDYVADNSYKQTRFGIIPYDPFSRAESLTFKACNFDDVSNFNMMISKNLTEVFNLLDLKDFTEDSFEYSVKLDKYGDPSKFNFIKPTSFNHINNLLLNVLSNIDFYYPSLENGLPIEDKLTIAGKIYKNSEGKITFLPIIIHREKGQ
ncbi:hypothetical protein LZQ00_16420 [Sphingobacterium sp. SRCM116780]|uniref:toxin-antitoxin system YwqK family antitoxin n=1 Tax=Sphingobacterium sp. SRCM116780 TaxID=2907623 RepID=UPI001F169807|nr:hypothetical protein [Sphingobacterium sp. SRCM116780]UIR55832.1 hypothetical protein LZQ00_16420 [Sphingobacterium sp. SRCM116780]